MRTAKRSLLLPFLVRAVLCMGQPASPADSLVRVLDGHPARDSFRVVALLQLADAVVYGEPAKAMQYTDEALGIADSAAWTKGIALALRQKGNVYYVFSDNKAAMDCYVKALRASGSLHNRGLDASLFNNLANIYSDLKQFDKALGYYRQLLEAAREAGTKKDEIIALVNMATVYTEMNVMDTALACNRQALDIARPNAVTYFIPIVLNNMGIAYSREGMADSALVYFREGILLADKYGNAEAKASSLNEMAKILLNRGDYTNARAYSLQSLAMARKLRSVEWQANAWENLYRIEEKLNRYAAALDAYKNFVLFRDSVLNAGTRDALTKKELQFDFERKEAALRAEHDKKEALAEAEISRQNLIRKGVLGGSAALLFAGIVGFILYKRRRDAEEEKKEAERKVRAADTEMKVLRLQMNPHFIFNSLNSISDYISKHETEKANHFLIKFARMMRQVLENSEKAEIPLADDLRALENYIQLEALRMKNDLRYEISVDEAIDPEVTLVPPLIVQPFVENSIWHGLSGSDDSGRISIHIRKEEGMINYIVEDNGIGRERAGRKVVAGKQSMGLGITKDRIEMINLTKKTRAGLEIIDLPGGTRVELRLPLELNY